MTTFFELIPSDTMEFLRSMSNDTLIKIHDALASEWFFPYTGPRDRDGAMLLDGYDSDGEHVFYDDVSWKIDERTEGVVGLGDAIEYWIWYVTTYANGEGE